MVDEPGDDVGVGQKEFRLQHLRAHDFRVHLIDGALHRIDGDTMTLTFYQDSLLTSHEEMELQSETGSTLAYSTKRVVDRHVRTDLFAVRIPVTMILGLAKFIFDARGKPEV